MENLKRKLNELIIDSLKKNKTVHTFVMIKISKPTFIILKNEGAIGRLVFIVSYYSFLKII